MLSRARASRHAGQSRPRTSSRHPVAGIQPGDLRCRQTESQGHRDPDPLQGAHLRRDSDFPFSRRSCVARSRPRSILVSLWSPISIRPYFGPEWNSRMPFSLVSIVAGNASARGPSDGTTLMNSAWASLQGLDIAIFGDGGVQRSIGGVSAIAFHVVGLGRPGRMIEPHRRLRGFSRPRMTKADWVLGKCCLIR